MNSMDSNRRLLMERSVPGRVGTVLPALDVPEQPLPSADMLREEVDLPEITEPEIVRYFTNLSRMNFSIDTHFYPLGSCTMKYNPKVPTTKWRSFPDSPPSHPLQPAAQIQGALELMHHLQDYLAEITGMAAVSLAPLAGAQGELSGVLMIQKYHQERGRRGAAEDAGARQRPRN